MSQSEWFLPDADDLNFDHISSNLPRSRGYLVPEIDPLGPVFRLSGIRLPIDIWNIDGIDRFIFNRLSRYISENLSSTDYQDVDVKVAIKYSPYPQRELRGEMSERKSISAKFYLIFPSMERVIMHKLSHDPQ